MKPGIIPANSALVDQAAPLFFKLCSFFRDQKIHGANNPSDQNNPALLLERLGIPIRSKTNFAIGH